VTAGPGRERYLMPWEAAEILLVAPKTLSSWARAGKVPYVRTLGGHRKYKESDIHALARAMREQSIT
jgi:excisionase family DNA binding protein